MPTYGYKELKKIGKDGRELHGIKPPVKVT
jgi:hypothetical protein